MQRLLLQFNFLGAFPGMTHSFGLVFFIFKLLPSDEEVPSTGTYRQSLSKEKAKGSSRPLAKAKTDWVYTMYLPLSEEGAMVFLLFLADLLLHLTFSSIFLPSEGGG